MKREALSEYINEESPFGPIKSEDLADEDLDLFRELYSSGTEIHQRLETHRPNCLLGRKGAGKTAFLLGLLIDAGSNIVQLNQSRLFAQMENVIRAFRASDAAVNAEITASIWEAAFHHALVVRVADTLDNDDHSEHASNVWGYVTAIENSSGLIEATDENERCDVVADWFLSALQHFVSQSTDRSAGTSFTAHLGAGGVTYRTMKDSCIALLSERAKRASSRTVVLIDNPEDFGDNFTNLAEVSRGLLHLLATHREQRTGFGIFVCLPAEVATLLREISANPAKSFERSLIIQWTSRDLVRLAAQRFALFLRLHDETNYRRLGIPSTERLDFDQARRILADRLPSHLTNLLGTREPTLPYLIRHTQLLPRQFIQYLNSVWRENGASRGEYMTVSDAAIRTGVLDAEQPLVQDILGAYKAQHPMASEVCERVIPRLHLACGVDDVKRAIRDTKAHQIASGDIDETLAMLVDIGALGRKRDETEFYHEADFSFTLQQRSHRMAPLQHDDTACLHGAFAQYFQSAEVRRNGKGSAKPVYPFGASLGDEVW